MKKNFFYTGIPWLYISIIILIIDFYTKRIILCNFKLYEYLELTKYLNIFYIQNFGIAFSFFSNTNIIWKCIIITIITLIICIVLIYNMYNQNINNIKYNLPYSLIIGGALGNLCDRMIHGFVIDFIDLHFFTLHLAIFNIADISISIGVLLLMIKQIFH